MRFGISAILSKASAIGGSSLSSRSSRSHPPNVTMQSNSTIIRMVISIERNVQSSNRRAVPIAPRPASPAKLCAQLQGIGGRRALLIVVEIDEDVAALPAPGADTLGPG